MADSRIAYGLAKKYGIDTKGMSPKEVWDALKEKGVTEEGYKKEQGEKKQQAEKIYNTDVPTPAENERLREMGIKDKPRENLSAEERRLKELGIEGNEALSASDDKVFHKTITEAKESNPPETRWCVDVHTLEDYKNDKLFVSKGGSCVAIEPNGNIISVCRKQGDNIRGKDLLRKAIENGGDRLDAFGKRLYDFYTRNGFEPISWTPFNRDYAPEGWKEEYEEQPVIFYKYTGKTVNEPYEKFIKRVNSSKDYDMAMKIRDEEMKK